MEAFEIKTAGVDQEIGQLSGGNQQKVILGREISHDPGLVLVAQPVRGLDIGAIEKVHKTLLELKEQGKAILLISAELSEVMNLSDRIAVFYEGGKRRNIGRVVNKLQFLHNGNQVVFHYTFMLEDNHGQLQSPPFSARMAPAYY